MLNLLILLVGALLTTSALGQNATTGDYCLNNGVAVTVQVGDKEIHADAPNGTVLATANVDVPFTYTASCDQALGTAEDKSMVFLLFFSQRASALGRDCWTSQTPGICFRIQDLSTGSYIVPEFLNGAPVASYIHSRTLGGFRRCAIPCLDDADLWQTPQQRQNQHFRLRVELVKYDRITPGLVAPFPGNLFEISIKHIEQLNSHGISISGAGTLRAVEHGCGLKPDSMSPEVYFDSVGRQAGAVGAQVKPPAPFTLNFACSGAVLPKLRFERHPDEPAGGAGFVGEDFALYTPTTSGSELTGLAFQIENRLNGQVLAPGAVADYALSGGGASAAPSWPFAVRLLRRLPDLRPGLFSGRAVINLLQP